MLGAKRLAEVMAANVAKGGADITFDEIVQIVRLYVALHNRLYEHRWREEEYLERFLRRWGELKER